MPKEVLVIRDFTTGLVWTDHGPDNPENSLAYAGNIDVNRTLGVLTLSGGYSAFQVPNTSTDALENFVGPENFKNILEGIISKYSPWYRLLFLFSTVFSFLYFAKINS